MGSSVVVLALLVVLAALAAGAVWGLAHCWRFQSKFAGLRFERQGGAPPRAGDLILFASAHSVTSSFFTQCFFTHVGVVVEGEGAGGEPVLLLAETREACGPRLVPLAPQLEGYLGLVCHSALAPPLGPAGRAALAAAAAARGAPYPRPADAAADALAGCCLSGTRHCFQHAAHLLSAAGITPHLARLGPVASSRAVCRLFGRPLAGGRRYGRPRRLN